MQFLLLPEDSLTLATVLKGPLVGFGEERLYALAQGRRERVLWHELRRRAAEHPDFARAEELLSGLLGRADFVPPYELLAEMLGERGGRQRMLASLGPDAADPLDELMAAALAYERRHGPSLQGFLHWLAAGDIEVKRDFDQRGRDEVRIMTVHGAKGLQAPIVFLPDTMQVPRQVPQIVWTEDGVPLWCPRDGGGAPALERARQAAKQRRDAEYRRLLYVAMTRAEDRLYVSGWRTKQPAPQGSWYALIAAGLGAADGIAPFDFTAAAALGADAWAGPGQRLVTAQSAEPEGGDAVAPAGHAAPLPDWSRQPPKPEPVPPRPLAPSRPEGTEPAPRSPLGSDAGAGFRRGLVVHRLLQGLPLLAPGARAGAARRFLARGVHRLDAEEQAAILAETLAVLADPAAAALFGPQSVAEVPVVALVNGRAISGRIDRLVVGADEVAIVDYKTLRPVPASEDAIPPLYLDQLRAYRSVVAAVYPGRRLRCGLLWTDGPSLMWVSEARLV
jgi:ATP-dependent helicase/nuclease subunit A